MKDVNGISFEEFPGKPYVVPDKNKKGNKRFITCFIIILISVILFIFFSVLNEWILTRNTKEEYKTVNDFRGNSAVIRPEERSKLFLDIGFDGSVEETSKMNGVNYVTTYAYKNHGNNLTDSINVYYDDNYEVNYVSLSLIYSKSVFTKSDMVDDCNLILQNFLNVKTSITYIDNLMQNYYFFTVDSKSEIEISYEITYESKDFYVMTIICKV